MGNCQAAEAATVVIEHPGNKIERIYWSLSANQVMDANPGHYVALVVNCATLKSENGSPMKQLKLLRPDDTLLIGQVYRLITFEDVLKELSAKKCVKLGKLMKDRGGAGVHIKQRDSKTPNPNSSLRSQFDPMKVEQEIHQMGSNGSSSSHNRAVGRQYGGGGGGGQQWRPTLQSISEVGTSTH